MVGTRKGARDTHGNHVGIGTPIDKLMRKNLASQVGFFSWLSLILLLQLLFLTFIFWYSDPSCFCTSFHLLVSCKPHWSALNLPVFSDRLGQSVLLARICIEPKGLPDFSQLSHPLSCLVHKWVGNICQILLSQLCDSPLLA